MARQLYRHVFHMTTHWHNESSMAATVSAESRTRGPSDGTASPPSDHGEPAPQPDPLMVSHRAITFSMNVQSIWKWWVVSKFILSKGVS